MSSNFRLLEPKISASNGGEEEDICFVFRIVHVFVHARKACGRHSSVDFIKRMGEVAILSLVYENMGYRDRNNIWSQERMIEFVDRLLLGLWTENEFRMRTRVTHNTFRFLCKM